MRAFLQEIQSSLLEIVGSSIKAIPGIVVAVVILLLTQRMAKLTQRVLQPTLAGIVQNLSLRSLLVKISYVLIWIIGALIAGVTAFPDLGVGDILALFGLSSVAFGLIFQETCKNFIAGAMLLLHEPFQLNDQIAIEGVEGTVEEIGFRTTQVLTYSGERVLLPNSMIFNQPVKLLTALPYRRTDLALGIDYSTSLAQTTKVLFDTLTQVEGVLSSPAPVIDMSGFGESAIQIMIRYWTSSRNEEILQTKTRVIRAIVQAFEQEKIHIPYPIRMNFLFDQQQFQGWKPRSAGLNLNE